MVIIPEYERGDPTPYKYKPNFKDLRDPELLEYITDDLYLRTIKEINNEKVFIEHIESIYISQEYIDELSYNSKANIYYGYTLEELDEIFEGTRYIFTQDELGKTSVIALEEYDDINNEVIQNVAIGTGVILISVTISLASGGLGGHAISMIFATAAKEGTKLALSTGLISGIISGTIKGMETKNMEEAVGTGLLSASESFKWSAILGSVTGGIKETYMLNKATLKGLTMNEAARIQKNTKYPVDLIKQFHSYEEFEVFNKVGLEPEMVNGKLALIRRDIDLKKIDEYGRTNLKRMSIGLPPLDNTGISYELHHIGQQADGSLAILTKKEHTSNIIHGMEKVSQIDRTKFETQKKLFWKTMSKILESGG